jgi:o-succinylbenzoate synthase
MPDTPPRRLRITRVWAVPYALPLCRPLRTAHETIAVRRGFVVWVRDNTGCWGAGEAAPLQGFGMESLEECAAALSAWEAALPGKEIPLPSEWSPQLPAVLGIIPDRTHCPAARHGLECALVDLVSQAHGMPLARWLHPGAATTVSVNATLIAVSPEEAAREAEAAVRQGFGTLKLKAAVAGDDADVRRVAAVRRTVDAAVRLRVDANGGWSEQQARRMLERLAPYGIEYLEQPVPAQNLPALARLAADSPVPIAADEAVSTEAGALEVLRLRAARVLVLKPMALGGLLATLRIVRQASAAGIPAVLTTMLEGAYGRTAALHAAAALPALAPGVPVLACGLATGDLLAQDLVAAAPRPVQGALAVPAAPGLGLPEGRPPDMGDV